MLMQRGSRWMDLGLSAQDVKLVSEFGRIRECAHLETLGPNAKKYQRVIVVAARGDGD